MNANRVMVFIDGSNIEMAIKYAFQNKRIDPIKLSKKLGNNRPLMRINYYEAPLWENVDKSTFDVQQKYFEFLRSDPLVDIRLGRRVRRDRDYKCEECGHDGKMESFEQKGVDILLSFDLVTLANRNAYDIAIVITGDQDFICPLLEVRMLGKSVENAFVDNSSWSPVLKSIADKTIVLDQSYLGNCWR